MKTSKTQILIENIQREIELLNGASLTHGEKRGALELISLELDELLFLHTSEVDRCEQQREQYKRRFIGRLVKMDSLLMTCMSVLKHRAHNIPVQHHLVALNELCRETIIDARESACEEGKIPF